MGECAYYLKAEFINKAAAEKAAKKMDRFFSKAIIAYEFYQGHREESTKLFWEAFEKSHPLISEYIKDAGFWDKSVEDLSGKLDFGQEDVTCIVQGTTVGYGSTNVWHFSDWSYLCAFIKKKYGAIKVVCDTEENGCGSLDSCTYITGKKLFETYLRIKTYNHYSSIPIPNWMISWTLR
jgi:hypothetical protein